MDFSEKTPFPKDPFFRSRNLGIANGGVPGRGCCVFFAWKSVIAREFLLKIDTALAIAKSGLRTNLLFERPPSENPPFDFPEQSQIRISFRSRSDLALDADQSFDFFILSRFAGVCLVL